jgi:hypothetical protein
MPVKTEVVEFLVRNLSAKSMVDRNIDIVLYHYGFTGIVAPTLDTTASQFDIGTRERVRQILQQAFLKKASLEVLPTLDICNKIITSKSIWLYSDLKNAIKSEIGDVFETSLQDLIYLIQDIGGAKGFKFFDCKFVELSRPALSECEECFITSKNDAKIYRKIMCATRTLPGILGIATVGQIDPAPLSMEYYRKAIEIDPTSWVYHDGDAMFFMYEERDNVLLNSAEKVFSIHDEVSVNRLANSMLNALSRRSTQHSFPSSEILERYLVESRHFEVNDDMISFKGEHGNLTEIENDTVTYLNKTKLTTFRPLRDYLLSRGHSRMNIHVAANYSSLVHLSRNEKNEKQYTLVGKAS